MMDNGGKTGTFCVPHHTVGKEVKYHFDTEVVKLLSTGAHCRAPRTIKNMGNHPFGTYAPETFSRKMAGCNGGMDSVIILKQLGQWSHTKAIL